MTTRTRRRVLVSLVVLALTLPAESILLKAVTAPNVKDAAKQYVSSLSASQLQRAAFSIEGYPYAYRRQIMAAVTPDVRVKVWQNHVALYVATHPTLDPQAADLLGTINGLLTPDLMSSPTSAERAQVYALINEVQQIIGRDDAAMLFQRLGPQDTVATVSEPISERLANYVRNAMTVLAEAGGDCDCSTDFGCDGTAKCDSSAGCSPDNEWPMCGWLWNTVCDGQCNQKLM